MEEDCDYQRHSPFYHIRSYIKCFNIFLGFPLKPVSKTYDEFIFPSLVESIKFYLLLGTIFVLHLVTPFFLFMDVGYDYFSKYLDAFGVSKLDVFVAFGEYQCYMAISIVCFFYFLSRSAKKINFLLGSMKKMNSQLERLGSVVDYDKLKRKPRKLIFYSHFGRLSNTCFATLMYCFVSNGYMEGGKRYTLVDDDSLSLIHI